MTTFHRKLTLRGPVPAKKNQWAPKAGGGMFLNREAAATIDSLIVQARVQWRKFKAEPLTRAVVHCTFFIDNGRADGDNRQTTILDVLQKAGVIQNDNAKRLPGASFRCVIQPGCDERTEVEVWEIAAAQAGRRHRE